MGNSIALIKQYGAENFDEIFVRDSCTGILENKTGIPLKPAAENAEVVYIPDIVMTGLGAYTRDSGYSDGTITIVWEPYALSQQRGTKFSLDRMDDAETAGVTAANLMKLFVKEKAIPQVDAYRLSTLAGKAEAANVKLESIADNIIISRLALGDEALENSEVDLENTILFVSTEVNRLIKSTTELAKRLSQAELQVGALSLKIKTFDGRPIVVVPKTRFLTDYVFNATGFAAVDNAAEINFMIVHYNSAIPYKKHEKIKVFSPDENQSTDGWLFQYRLYHDIFTTKNKTKGIYVNRKAKALTVTFVDAHATTSGTLATPQAFVEGTALALTQNTGTNSNSGLAFKGWALTQALATAGTVKYLDKASITITENISLYAVWAA